MSKTVVPAVKPVAAKAAEAPTANVNPATPETQETTQDSTEPAAEITSAPAPAPEAPAPPEPVKEEQKTAKVDNSVKTAVAPAQKLAKVRPLKNHACNIAQQEYTFVKDEVTEVPEDVCIILQNAGVLIKL